MLTFRAFYLDGRHGLDLGVLIIHDRNLILRAHLLGLHLVG